MDLKDYKYRSTFTSVAKIVNPSEKDRFVAKASLLPLKGLIPDDVDVAADSDLLYFAADGAVGGLINRNGDGISNATAISIYKTAKNKFLSIEHQRTDVIGVILFPGLSRFGTNEIIDEATAATLQEPINMCFGGVIWKVVSPLMAKYVANMAGETGDDSISLSWEIAFRSYSCAVNSQNLFDAKIIGPDDAAFAEYDKCLRANGGSGKDRAGNDVSRVIDGDPVILGFSAVGKPAAHVSGILPIVKEEPAAEVVAAAPSPLDQIPESQRAYLQSVKETGAGYHMCDVIMKDGVVHANVPVLNCLYAPSNIVAADITAISLSSDASTAISVPAEEINVTLANASVNNNTTKNPMKIEHIDQLETLWPELVKQEAKASVASIKEAIHAASEKYITELAAKENLVKNAEEAKAAADERAKTLEASLAELRKELKEVKASQEAAEAQTKFTERMSAFDEEFDLDDEDRSIIASDIKTLDDESFAAYMAKSKKLMCGKAKKKAPPFKKSDEKEETEEKKENKEGSASVKEAIASVKENAGQSTITAGVTVDTSVLDMVTAAFGESMKIDGKSVASKK